MTAQQPLSTDVKEPVFYSGSDDKEDLRALKDAMNTARGFDSDAEAFIHDLAQTFTIKYRKVSASELQKEVLTIQNVLAQARRLSTYKKIRQYVEKSVKG